MRILRTCLPTVLSLSTLLFLTMILGGLLDAQEQPQDANPQAGPEELTRGPIHEAFGKPVTLNPKPGHVIPKQPPAPIEELPPDQKPEGDNVAWIPGYWSWDDERDDFIWTSGFWRVLPPDREWVAGYWNKVENGYQWTSGYWAAAEAKEAEYLTPPPESVEAGPSTQPPQPNQVWVPGTWVWHTGRYMWRPGYWVATQPGWIWVPAHYTWTPCGYVFVDGYWDYSVRRRGVLFAPVYVAPVVYARPGFVYTPAVVIDGDVVTEHFFVRPSHCHYYFGDYYATSYVSVGFTPWFSFHYSRCSYDPIFAYYECHYRTVDPGWSVRIHASYTHRVRHVDARPPRTFVQQNVVINNINKTTVVNNVNVNNVRNTQNMALGKPLNQVAASKDGPIRLQKLDAQQRQESVRQLKEARQSTEQRVKQESEAARLVAARPREAQQQQPLKLERPKTPVVAKAAPKADKDKAPPPLPAAALQDRRARAATGGETAGPRVPQGSKDGQPGKPQGNQPAVISKPQDDKTKPKAPATPPAGQPRSSAGTEPAKPAPGAPAPMPKTGGTTQPGATAPMPKTGGTTQPGGTPPMPKTRGTTQPGASDPARKPMGPQQPAPGSIQRPPSGANRGFPMLPGGSSKPKKPDPKKNGGQK